MAEAGGFALIPPLSSLPAPISSAVREQWEAEFSRFFIFPRRCSSPKAVLRPLSGITFRYGRGTWLTASSPATILICKATSDAVAVLSVSVSGFVYEEHLLLNLQLSWPQVACVPQCPIRGSRAVFMSFSDRFSQVQKFALRFPTSAIAETFFNFVKDCTRETIDISPAASVFVSDWSSPSEVIAPNASQNRLEDRQSQGKAIIGEMPSAAFGGDHIHHPLPPFHATDTIDDSISGLPPSFTELLKNCSKELEREPSMQPGEADNAPESVENASVAQEKLPSPRPENVAQHMFMLESDIKNEIMKYMSDASFHDMLAKIEKVIHELGGEFSL